MPILRYASQWSRSDSTILGVGCGLCSCDWTFGNMSDLGGLIRKHLLQLGAAHVACLGPVSIFHISLCVGASYGWCANASYNDS